VQLLEEADVRGRLPVLGKNLLLGDSLLSPPGAPLVAKAVDWASISQEDRGFDAILTNPPFLTGYKRSSKLPGEKSKQLAALYPQVDSSYADYSYLFVELGLRLLGENGVGGFVLPAGVVKARSAAPVRARLAEFGVRSVIDFDAGRLFDADTYVCTVSTGSTRSTELLRATDLNLDGRALLEDAERPTPALMRRQRLPRRLVAAEAVDGWDAFRLQWKLDLSGDVEAELVPLRDKQGTKVRYGTKPGRQRDFTLESSEWSRINSSKLAVGEHRIPEVYLPRLVKGGHLSPFFYSDSGQRLFLPYETDGSLSQLPDVVAELDHRGGLPTNPRHGDLSVLRGPKILLRTLSPEIAAVADLDGDLMPLMGEGGAIAIRMSNADPTTLSAYEALLNSSFSQWWLGGMAWPRQGGWLALNVSIVEALPVPHLAQDDVGLLSGIATAFREALTLEDPAQRLRDYHRIYAELDQMIFELLGISSRLRSIISREVKRVV
jgi:hypothetical protein